MEEEYKNYPFYDWVPKPLGIIFMIILFVPMITTGLSGSLSGRVSTIWANPLRTTRMPGPATVPYSASLTWQACPKTAIICTAASGTRPQIPCTSFRTGHGRAGKERILPSLFIPAIPLRNFSSMARATASNAN